MRHLQIAALGLSSLLATAAASADSVWLASDSKVLEVDVSSGEILDSTPSHAVAQLAVTADGRVWVLAKDELALLARNAGRTAPLDLASLGYPAATLLTVNPYDASVWAATSNRSLLHVDQTGVPLGDYVLPETPAAAGIALDESLWIVGLRSLWHLGRDGNVISRLEMPESQWGVLSSVSIDSVGQRVWVTGTDGVTAVDTSQPSRPAVSAQISLKDTRASALDGRTGVLWVLTGEALLGFNRDGRSAATLDLIPWGAANATGVTFDAAQEVLVVAGEFGAVGLTSTGGHLFTVSTSDAIAHVSGAPLVIEPVIRISPPLSAAFAQNKPSELVIELDALCSGAGCRFPSSYFSTYRVTATLNGQAIDQHLVFDSNRGVLIYRAPSSLPKGRNVLSARATDRFGHDSAAVQLQWVSEGAKGGEDLTASETAASANIQAAGAYVLLAAAAGKNQAPSATLTAPQAGASFPAGATIALAATASDPDGSVAQVDFFAGTTLIGSDSTAPHSADWVSVPAGSYSLTAKSVDNLGATGTSSAVAITVTPNAAPVVSLTSPADQSKFEAGSTIPLVASASDPDGSITQVEFYSGSTLLQTVTAPPFQFSWPNVGAGSYTIVAKATDNQGAVTTSSSVSISVVRPPLVVLTSPASCTRVDAPGSAALSADAESPGGAIAKVEFFEGATLIATDTLRPFTAAVSGLTQGDYSFSAKATDVSGFTSISRSVQLAVGPANMLPSVTLTAPADGATFGPSPSITLTADASDSDGTIASVTFFRNGTQALGTATGAPYSITWNGAAAGTYTFTAVATDDRGGSTTSAPINITVNPNTAPTVSITAPATGSTFYQAAPVEVTATATDSDGSVSQVDFFADGSFIGSDTTPPYAVVKSNLSVGTHTITARATDNLGAETTSPPISIDVLPNSAPTASITEPASGASFFAPATIRITASASDSDGSIARVDFYAGSLLIGSATAQPYSLIWDPVNAGSYNVKAVAVDDRGGIATSASVPVTVSAGPSISFEPGLDGSGIADDRITLTGSVIAPPNSGILVNGIPAVHDREGGFFINNLPLAMGANTITAVLNTEDGQSASASITVTRTGALPVTAEFSESAGFTQLASVLTIRNRGNTSLQRIDIDFDSNGSIDFSTSALTDGRLQLSVTFPAAGIYNVRIIARDLNDNIISDLTQIVHAFDEASLDGLVRAVWDKMNTALLAGNVAKAVQHIAAESRAEYQQVFSALAGVMPDIVGSYSDLQRVTLRVGSAVYAVNRAIEGQDTIFLIHAYVDANGVWCLERL